eukprot:6419397-Amphidinium_carterae.1
MSRATLEARHGGAGTVSVAVERVGVQTSSPPLQRFGERGLGHDWSLYQVLDAEGEPKGELLSCSRCGCYIHARAKMAMKECHGEHGLRATCKLQQRRVAEGRHPRGGIPFATWHLERKCEDECLALLTVADARMRPSMARRSSKSMAWQWCGKGKQQEHDMAWDKGARRA